MRPGAERNARNRKVPVAALQGWGQNGDRDLALDTEGSSKNPRYLLGYFPYCRSCRMSHLSQDVGQSGAEQTHSLGTRPLRRSTSMASNVDIAKDVRFKFQII